jgi:hypothetical protein
MHKAGQRQAARVGRCQRVEEEDEADVQACDIFFWKKVKTTVS